MTRSAMKGVVSFADDNADLASANRRNFLMQAGTTAGILAAGMVLNAEVSPIRTGQIGVIIGERDYALHCGSSHLATRSSCCIKVKLSSMCQLSAMRPLAMR